MKSRFAGTTSANYHKQDDFRVLCIFFSFSLDQRSFSVKRAFGRDFYIVTDDGGSNQSPVPLVAARAARISTNWRWTTPARHPCWSEKIDRWGVVMIFWSFYFYKVFIMWYCLNTLTSNNKRLKKGTLIFFLVLWNFGEVGNWDTPI